MAKLLLSRLVLSVVLVSCHYLTRIVLSAPCDVLDFGFGRKALSSRILSLIFVFILPFLFSLLSCPRIVVVLFFCFVVVVFVTNSTVWAVNHSFSFVKQQEEETIQEGCVLCFRDLYYFSGTLSCLVLWLSCEIVMSCDIVLSCDCLCVVLCCAVLCRAVLCCVVLCCVVLSCVVLCCGCVVFLLSCLWCAMLCCVVL